MANCLFRYGFAPVLFVFLAFSGAAPAGARTFTVNSTADALDAAPGNCICADDSGKCTLRAAIQEANACAGTDVVALGARVYYLTIPGQGEDDSTSGDLDIRQSVTVIGQGANLTYVDGGALDRVFHVMGDANVSLSKLTITNGWAAQGSPAPSGGGVRWDPAGANFLQISSCTISNNFAYPSGGGLQVNDIAHQATLRLNGCTILNNHVTTDESSQIVFGGGAALINVLKATIVGGAVRGNMVLAPGPGTTARGGGLAFHEETNATLSGVRITDNSAVGADIALGGGIDDHGGALKLTSVTVNGNKATSTAVAGSARGGGYHKDDTGKATISSSTFAGNTAQALMASGGGVYVDEGNGGSGTSMISVAVRGNHCVGTASAIGMTTNGGGVFVKDAPGFLLSSCVITGNHIESWAGGAGGGIFMTDTGQSLTYTVQNSTISNNQIRCNGTAYGGGLYHDFGNLVLTGCRLQDNVATGLQSYGGGINAENAQLVLNGGTVVKRNILGGLIRRGGGVFEQFCTLPATGIMGNIPNQVDCP